ncbi:hypothetical protein HDU93_002768 [Gonapodya sp. JEL0774]|nr:hypothetical protein HDU93_002768 [Gonapodya sp. JEL0774]
MQFTVKNIGLGDVKVLEASAECLNDGFGNVLLSQYYTSLMPADPKFRSYMKLRNWRSWLAETPRFPNTVWVASPGVPDKSTSSPGSHESTVSSVAIWFPPEVPQEKITGTWWWFLRWKFLGWVYTFLKTFSLHHILLLNRARTHMFSLVGPAHGKIMGDRPHFYLHFLSTFTKWRGKGSASAVLQPVLKQADERGLECYLEAANPGLVPFYEKLGFQERGQIDLKGDGSIIFVPMVRPPKKST